MIERRHYVRFEVNLPLKFKDLNNDSEGKGELHDISAKGVGFVTDRELSPNTSLDISIEMPNKSEYLCSKGQVIWSSKIDTDKYRVGVELEKIDFVGLSVLLSMQKII
ncbi:MAG: PilZ domain-containing protein [Candidatus Omnitrophica bacterium]|nr:PilZ domain-containing protein [Candidatus Omnitrophota bacterium]